MNFITKPAHTERVDLFYTQVAQITTAGFIPKYVFLNSQPFENPGFDGGLYRASVVRSIIARAAPYEVSARVHGTNPDKDTSERIRPDRSVP